MMRASALLVLALAACHAPATARAMQPDTSAPVTVLHVLTDVLTDSEGAAVRGAPVEIELDDRLYILTGERGLVTVRSSALTAGRGGRQRAEP